MRRQQKEQREYKSHRHPDTACNARPTHAQARTT
jgi:hypothetical protein